jgi:hypothetical protein
VDAAVRALRTMLDAMAKSTAFFTVGMLSAVTAAISANAACPPRMALSIALKFAFFYCRHIALLLQTDASEKLFKVPFKSIIHKSEAVANLFFSGR